MGALIRDASVSARLSPPASIWALALPEGAGRATGRPGECRPAVRRITEGRAATIGSAWWTWRAHGQVRVGG
jgi:hypothetical protein